MVKGSTESSETAGTANRGTVIAENQ